MLLLNCINNIKSAIHPSSDGQMIRTSYLLGDVTKVSGSSYLLFDFEQCLLKCDERFKKQMVLNYCSRVADPAYLQEVESMYETIKDSKMKVKHANKDLIVARKKCEKHLDILFKNSIQEMRNMYSNYGYADLETLEQEGAIVLRGSIVEKPESDDNNAVPYSKILSSKWEEEDEVVCFTGEFREFAEQQNLVVSSGEEDDDSPSVILFPLPSIVPLHSCSSTELKVIKQEVFGDAVLFREAIAEWSAALKTENYDAIKSGKYHDFYNERIKPYCDDISERMLKSELLSKVEKMFNGAIGFENYLAIAPAKIVWGFMEWSGMVPKESVYAFEHNLPQGCDEEKSVLLLLSRPFNYLKEEEAGDKKSLEL